MNSIKSQRVVFPDPKVYKFDCSDEIKDLITKLLTKDPADRLGASGDVDEILEHPAFAKIDTEALLKKEIEPPFVPNKDKKDEFDKKMFNVSKVITESHVPTRAQHLIDKNKDKFDDFDIRKKK